MNRFVSNQSVSLLALSLLAMPAVPGRAQARNLTVSPEGLLSLVASGPEKGSGIPEYLTICSRYGELSGKEQLKRAIDIFCDRFKALSDQYEGLTEEQKGEFFRVADALGVLSLQLNEDHEQLTESLAMTTKQAAIRILMNRHSSIDGLDSRLIRLIAAASPTASEVRQLIPRLSAALDLVVLELELRTAHKIEDPKRKFPPRSDPFGKAAQVVMIGGELPWGKLFVDERSDAARAADEYISKLSHAVSSVLIEKSELFPGAGVRLANGLVYGLAHTSHRLMAQNDTERVKAKRQCQLTSKLLHASIIETYSQVAPGLREELRVSCMQGLRVIGESFTSPAQMCSLLYCVREFLVSSPDSDNSMFVELVKSFSSSWIEQWDKTLAAAERDAILKAYTDIISALVLSGESARAPWIALRDLLQD